MKILHVINDFSFPANHGGRVDMWGRLQCFSELGFDIDVIATVKQAPTSKDVAHVREYVSDLTIIERKSNLHGVFSNIPMQVSSRDGLRFISLEAIYDFVLLESEFTSPILLNKTLRTRKSILRVHNDESRYMGDVAKQDSSLISKMYHRIEEKRFAKYSPRIFKSVDHLWFSSAAQHEQHIHKYPNETSRAVWLPPPVDLERMEPPTVCSSKKVLFVGGLTAISNLQGLKWYLSNVHPRLLYVRDYEFVIAGSTRGMPLSPILIQAIRTPRCRVLTDVEDLTPTYRSCAVFINCMQYGASIKMKTVNAAEHGLAIVSTRVGNEGTGFIDGEHILVADDECRFFEKIKFLLENPERATALARNAQGFLRKYYQHSENILRILNLNVLPMHQ